MLAIRITVLWCVTPCMCLQNHILFHPRRQSFFLMINLMQSSVSQRVLCLTVAWLAINELARIWEERSWPASEYLSGSLFFKVVP